MKKIVNLNELQKLQIQEEDFDIDLCLFTCTWTCGVSTKEPM